MSVEEITKLIDSISRLVSALVWPVLVAFALIRFGPTLKDFLRSLGEFSFKGAGFEASAKLKQVEVTAALVAAAANRPDVEQPELAANEAKDAVNLVQDEVTPRLLRKASRSTILWVDDHPEKASSTEIAVGLLATLQGLAAGEAGRISKHLTGEAFDIQPVETDADAIKAAARALPGARFLEREGGLVRWHVQF